MIYSWRRMNVHLPQFCTQITKSVKIVAPYQVDGFLPHFITKNLIALSNDYDINLCSWYSKLFLTYISIQINNTSYSFDFYCHKFCVYMFVDEECSVIKFIWLEIWKMSFWLQSFWLFWKIFDGIFILMEKPLRNLLVNIISLHECGHINMW